MIKDITVFVYLAVAAFLFAIIFSLIGNFIQISDPVFLKKMGKISIYVMLVLMLVMGFSLVPIAIKFVTDMQVKFGNGDLPFVKFFINNGFWVVLGCWAFMILGLIVALPPMIKDGFFNPKFNHSFTVELTQIKVPGQLPTLKQQIDNADALVLARTFPVIEDDISYLILEVIKSNAPVDIKKGKILTVQSSVFQDFDYKRLDNQEVFLFFTQRNVPAPNLFEILPIVDGKITYAPYDLNLKQVLTTDQFRAMVKQDANVK